MKSQESDSLYRDIFESAPDAIMVHDVETGAVVEANQAAAAMLGLERTELLGLTVGDFSPPSYTTEEANAVIDRALRDGHNEVEWSIRGPDGQRRWVDVSLERVTLDEQPRVIAFVRDVTEHKRAQRRYRTERDMLDRLLDTSPVGIVIHDANGTIKRANEQAESMLGVGRTALVGEAAMPSGISIRHLDGEPLDSSEIPFEIVRRTGENIHDRELLIERADGTTVAVSVSAAALRTDDTLERVVVNFVDVTDRRERDRKRRERTQQLQTLVNNLPVVVFTLDTDGTFIQSAGKGLETLGIEPGEFEGSSIFEAYSEYDDVVDAVNRALDGQEVRETQTVYGRVFETWYQPVFDGEGQLAQVVGVARDITEITRREQRVERLSVATRELLYAESARSVAKTVTTIAKDIVDRPIAAMWGYEETTDALTPLGATTEAADVASVADADELQVIPEGTAEKAIFEAGEPTVIEDYQQLDDPSAPDRPLGSLLCLPLDGHGLLNVASTEVEPFDETEQLLLEILASTATAALERVEKNAEMASQRAELERSNEALQQFAYLASHDLQEPLRMVSSYVDLLAMEYGDQLDEEAQEYIDFAVDGADRMKAMIDGLLAYSRVTTDAESFEAVETEAVLSSAITGISLLLADADVTVEYEDLPRVAADRSQLGQVFQNLLDNAVTHGEAQSITVEATARSDVVEFAVRDDGRGIPDDQHDHIFDIFSQGRRNRGGSGIGLATCERIVDRHDGEMWVESTLGEGTTFFFTMPRVRAGEKP